MEIQEEDLLGSKQHLNNKVKIKANQTLKETLEKSANEKSKMQYYLEGKKEWKIGQRAKYINELTRNKVSIIFRARTRMLQVKGNYKNGYKDLKCRACKKEIETQQHILEECQEIHQSTPKVTKEMIFNENTENLTKTAEEIQRIMDKLEESKSTCL